jgi:predicted PurR-regulated permease PerM
MGGFLRGELFLGVLISAIQTIGLFFIGVPYLFFLAVIIFIGEFLPQIGAYISAAIIVIITFLTRGWQVGLIAMIFCAVVNAGLEGQILAPRIIGHSVGLHPIISIAALLIATQLFGLIGAFLAAPMMGMIQVFILAVWHSWKQRHPEQFPEEYAAGSLDSGKGQGELTDS